MYSRKILGKEYNLSGASIARYLRLNELSDSWKEDIDRDEIGLTMAVDLSRLIEDVVKEPLNTENPNEDNKDK